MDIVKTTGFSAVRPYSAQSSPAAATSFSASAPTADSTIKPVSQASKADGDKAEKPEESNMDGALSKLKSKFQEDHRNLDFSIDDSTGEVVVKVLDGESGKLIRQMPSEEVLKLAKQLDEMRSLMFKAEA
ncbi:flagellar protein FlaG [Pseudomonas sp. LA5]|uniref:flagellar protein FlaG n=1 Tax=Pseudomonas sp. LA5 TaxID=3027850 RepID=UPI0023601CBD|nr:flagellar protein FlaG [Pseudomonas sp. LA5]